MALSQEFLDELHDRLPIEDFLSSYVDLKKRGSLYVGLCPFHNEKTGSFTVYPNTKSYYCFGCGAGGDIITFAKEYENLDYIEAIKFLADKAGMAMPDDTDRSETDKKKRLLEANKLAGRYFFECLNSDAGKQARAYLRRRGLSDATITRFGLGFAPEGWNGLRDYLKGKGYSYEEQLEAGLLTKSEKNDKVSYYDFFRGRVMFPVIDVRGQIVAFSGRTMGDDKPKYLNTRDTPVFKKSKVLFGLNFAKNADTNKVILVEGQMDVIALHQAGFTDAVATLGTAITEEHARMLSRYVNEVVISYDADGAGQKATKRAIDTLRNEGMPVRVVQIEGGKDPDELIKSEGSSAYQSILDKATGSMEYELAKAKKNNDLETPEGKIEYVKQATEILAGVVSRAEREIWASKVADETGVKRDTILDSVHRVIKSRRYAQEKKEKSMLASSIGERYNLKKYEKNSLGSAAAERRLLALLNFHPDLEDRISSRVSGENFVSAEIGAVFDAVCTLIRNGEFTGYASASSVLDSGQMSIFSAVLAENSEVKSSVNDCDFFIDKILERSAKPSEEDLRNMDADAIRKMIENKTRSQGENK